MPNGKHVNRYVIVDRDFNVGAWGNMIRTYVYNISWGSNVHIDSARLHIYVTASSFGAEVHLAMNGYEVYSWVAPWFPPYRDERDVDVLNYLLNGDNTFTLHLYNHRIFVGITFHVTIVLILTWHYVTPPTRPSPPRVTPRSVAEKYISKLSLVLGGAAIGGIIATAVLTHVRHVRKRR